MNNFDATRFVVLGEGLAAGMSNFSLFDEDQRESFGAQMAKQMRVEFAQPLFQPPGLGDAPGFPRLPVRVPFDQQTTVLSQFPPAAPFANLSGPGLTLADALTRRPTPPLVHANDATQTAVNFVLGTPALLQGGNAKLPTALEYALQQRPTFAVVQLGYAEILQAATAANAGLLPEVAAFRAHYANLLAALRAAQCDVLVTTIPDPMDTAHFSSIEAASRVVKLPPAAIRNAYRLQSHDRITVNGLIEIGCQVMAKHTEQLPSGSILPGDVAAEISNRVVALNGEIAALAGEHGAVVADLHGLFHKVRDQGVVVGTKTLTADFLGGFFSLNGYYPGRTGQALIANALLEVINRTYGTRFDPIDLDRTMRADPVAAYQAPVGPNFQTMSGRVASIVYTFKFAVAFAGIVGGMVAGRLRRKAESRPPAGGSDPARWTLQLPPGMTQVLPLNADSSYYGDALRPVHTADKKEAELGLTGKLLFGGLALLDSRLHGSVKIKFFPPVNDVAHFEVSHLKGLKGDDGRLSAAQFFKLPGLQNQVMDGTDRVSSGDLNLITGEVTNLQYRLFFLNSAILSLAAVNPALPADPMSFPGNYGSAWARFEQRPDGKLDYTSHATTFIPLSTLGVPVRFPLPFASPNGNMASIPCDGTALHPHIHVSTKAPEAPTPGADVPVLPVNTIREFTASGHNDTFGEDLSLNAREPGGSTMGRPPLAGRFQIQFGERFGDAISIAVLWLPPAALLSTLPRSPIADPLLAPTGQLQFSTRTHDVDSGAFVDDPLDISVAAVSVKTGKVIGPLLRRGTITTSSPLSMTFPFRAPASFEKGENGQLVFRYDGRASVMG